MGWLHKTLSKKKKVVLNHVNQKHPDLQKSWAKGEISSTVDSFPHQHQSDRSNRQFVPAAKRNIPRWQAHACGCSSGVEVRSPTSFPSSPNQRQALARVKKHLLCVLQA